MKTVRFLAGLFVLVFALAWSQMAFAEQKSITLPKGTTVEKLGAGHFKFKLPNGQVVEVKDFNPRTGAVSYVGIIEPDPPGKQGKLTTGKQGKLTTTKKLTREEAKKLPAANYVMIDDEITWLPATIIFKPAELSPQPDPPGKR